MSVWTSHFSGDNTALAKIFA